MRVLVDTCVWSAVLRHKTPDQQLADQLKDFINAGRVVMMGPIRQEILAGLSNLSQFQKLNKILSAYEDIPLGSAHYVKAAEFSNVCRAKGIQGSTTDFLICAVAVLEDLTVFTIDSDFDHYRKLLKVKLVQ